MTEFSGDIDVAEPISFDITITTPAVSLEADTSHASITVSQSSSQAIAPSTSQMSIGAALAPPIILYPVPGAGGPRGAPGTNSQVVGEVPAGTQNGVNTVFTTANTFVAGTTVVYRNGLREYRGYGYTESLGTTITFSEAPLVDDMIELDYQVAA